MRLQSVRFKFVVSLAGFFLLNLPPCAAKLGENINEFRSKLRNNFTFKGQSVKDHRNYYLYTMKLSADVQTSAPGFTGGLTITAENGIITGQSMLIQFGENEQAGKTLAVMHALDFAIESLGLAVPQRREEIDRELSTYTTIVNNAMLGQAQNIRYPKSKGKVTVTKQAPGALILAATFG